jgi:hypothetical protein
MDAATMLAVDHEPMRVCAHKLHRVHMAVNRNWLMSDWAGDEWYLASCADCSASVTPVMSLAPALKFKKASGTEPLAFFYFPNCFQKI